jgi:AraC family transcriptional regulator
LNEAVERVVAYLYEQYDQPISLADMADVAFLSQFHFARTFREVTGVSPGRFLSAIRLHRAKGLLMSTSLTVTDISYMVGYNSLGTFTSRFSKSVGVTPLQFRTFTQADMTKVVPDTGGTGGRQDVGSMAGWLTLPEGLPELRMYVGVFDGAIVQRMPVSCTVLESETAFQLDGVPEGEWYVFAAAVDPHDTPIDEYGARVARLVAREGPVKSVRGQTTMLRLPMRPCCFTDPPMLLALPGLVGCGVRQAVATLA